MELVISVVVGILIVEAYVWLPKISDWLIERAVQRLRSEDQDRCREEWLAGLDALPNTVIKLVHALSYLGAARRINSDFYENKLYEINALIKECGYKYSGLVVCVRASKEKFDKSQNKLDSSGLKAHEMLLPHAELRTSLESLADTFYHGIDRVNDFMTVCVDRVAERLNHVNDLLLRASKKRDQVIELLGRRDVSPELVDTLLAELASDLHTVKYIFEDDKWGDDDSLRAAERLTSALVGGMRSVTQLTQTLHERSALQFKENT